MIDLAYPSKHETLRVIRGMAHKALKLPFPETMVETPMPQASSAALQGVVFDSRAGWVDGELRVYNSLSKAGQRVWRWLKDEDVTDTEPTPTNTSFFADVSDNTAIKILRQYRAFHGIE
jgi:hypothetical protein